MNYSRFVAAMASGAAFPLGSAVAQTITAAGGNARFTYNTGSVPTTGTGIGGGASGLDINGQQAGGDQLFENWWWYRVDGVDTREFRYHAASNPFVASGDTMTGAFQFAEFRSNLRITIYDPDAQGTNTGGVSIWNTVTNTSALARTINIFQYADIDANGEVAGNTYEYHPDCGHFEIRDAAPQSAFAYFHTFSASAFQAAPFTTVPGQALRGLAADDDIDNLNNTVAGSPGDFTGAFQWTISLQPGEAFEILSTFQINYPPCFPSPGTVSLVALGLIGSTRRRRGI